MILKVPIQILKFLVSALILLTGPVLQGQNLVTNGNFENGFSGWVNLSGGTSVAAYSLETASPYQGVNSMKALVTTAGTNYYDAQSLGPSLAMTEGTNYTMTFYAKAALAGTSIRMVVQNTKYLSQSFSLTAQWANYTWAFTVAEPTPRLRINYGQAGTFWIDNISVLPTPSTLTLTISPQTLHQEMVGFGGALTWYRERVLTSPHSAAIKQLLFDDLGLDVLRFKNWYYPTGYPTNKSASDPDSKALYDTAKAANPEVKALLSSWSPPASLKSNGTLNNGGTLASDANGYRYAELGQYFVDALDNLGWTPDYLSFQNEPGYVATWDSCIFRPTQTPVNAGYAEASDAIYNAIKDRPNAPVMIGAEAESIGTASWSDWKSGAQVNRFREMNTPLLSRPYIGAHAYHTYNMYNESQIDGAIPQLNMIRDEFSDRPNFMTEFSNDNFDWLAAARAVHNTVVEGNASAYFYWTLVWDPGASCMIGIAADGTYTVGPHYYMLKHYSKFVSIGHRRIEVSGSTSDVKISGFINPKGSEITLVVINNATSAKNVDLVQNSWPRQSIAADSSVAYQSVVDHYFQNIGTVDISTTQTLPAKSMTTYVVSLSQNRSWTGASGTAWDVNSSANWLEGDQKFFQFDKVTFGDTGAGNVAVTGVLTPDSITVNSASNYHFTAAAGNYIAGAGSLTKGGSGVLTLGGLNSFTGTTTINQGSLNLGGGTAAGSIGSGPLVMGGGALAYTRTGNTTQTFTTTRISAGASTLSAVTGNTLNLGTISRNAGATVTFDNTGGGTFQGTATLANSILRWATIRKTGTAENGSSNGFTFATVTGGALVPYTAATSSSFAWKGGNNTINYDITGPGNVTSSRDANSVRYLGTIDTIQNYNNTTLTLNALLNASANSLTLQRQSASSTATLAIGNSNELVLAAAAGPITIAMPITGTSGSVTKTGANTVTLSAANTYIGTTMVNEGTLTVTGSLDATSVEVKNSATLAGTGPLGGNVTVRPGGHQAFNVAATSGTQTTRTINGSLTLEAGNIIDLSAAASPAPGGPYVLITATGGIIGTPGSVTLNGLAGSVVKNGNNLELTVTAPAGFSGWAATPGFGLAPEDQDPTDDPDNDGISNLMEYVLNGNPGASSTHILPAADHSAPTDIIFTFTRREESAADTTQVFQYGTDLSNWTPINITGTPGPEVTLGTPALGLQLVTVKIPESAAGASGRLFGRLKITHP